jgi:hypothetical protein
VHSDLPEVVNNSTGGNDDVELVPNVAGSTSSRQGSRVPSPNMDNVADNRGGGPSGIDDQGADVEEMSPMMVTMDEEGMAENNSNAPPVMSKCTRGAYAIRFWICKRESSGVPVNALVSMMVAVFVIIVGLHQTGIVNSFENYRMSSATSGTVLSLHELTRWCLNVSDAAGRFSLIDGVDPFLR